MPPHEVPDGSVVITPAEVYSEVKVLTDNVRTLIAQDQTDKDERRELARRVTMLESRVSSVEQKVWVAAGFAAALGSAGATLLARAMS